MSDQVRKIKAIETKGYSSPLRVIVAHPWQIVDLVADPAFKSAVQAAFVQNLTKDNPFLVGCLYVWEGFAIYANESVAWPVRTESSLPVYGP